MSRRRVPAALVALALAASPSVAAGQSAGDDQYEDPFGGDSPQSATPEPGEPAPESDPPVDAPAPEPASPSAAEATQAPEVSAGPPSAAPAGELPRTGLETGVVGAGGTALVLCGIALRIRLARGGRRD